MNRLNSKPFQALGLTEEEERFLRALWIDSLEELAAVLREDSPERSLAGRWGAERVAAISGAPVFRQARAGLTAKALPIRALGYRPPPLLAADVQQRALLAVESGYPLTLPERPDPYGDDDLPPQADLRGGLGPARDQGRRGTCVAFGATALREHLAGRAGGAPPDLSEQFLYWGCKQHDPWPGQDGSNLTAAQQAYREYGICLESFWPYEPDDRPDDVTHGEPAASARENAGAHRLQTAEPFEASQVNYYKRVLSGADGLGGRPVVIATAVFMSWFESPAFHLTGKMTMPLPGEQPLAGGHAWCVVGYRDDGSVPGGGYFIFRNSWGSDWAPESPIAPGHAMVPYAFVRLYAYEAFTAAAPVAGASEWTKYAQRLGHDAVSVFNEHVRSGTPVIQDHAGWVAPDNEANRREFQARHWAWADGPREDLWRFRRIIGLPAGPIQPDVFVTEIGRHLQQANWRSVKSPFQETETYSTAEEIQLGPGDRARFHQALAQAILTYPVPKSPGIMEQFQAYNQVKLFILQQKGLFSTNPVRLLVALYCAAFTGEDRRFGELIFQPLSGQMLKQLKERLEMWLQQLLVVERSKMKSLPQVTWSIGSPLFDEDCLPQWTVGTGLWRLEQIAALDLDIWLEARRSLKNELPEVGEFWGIFSPGHYLSPGRELALENLVGKIASWQGLPDERKRSLRDGLKADELQSLRYFLNRERLKLWQNYTGAKSEYARIKSELDRLRRENRSHDPVFGTFLGEAETLAAQIDDTAKAICDYGNIIIFLAKTGIPVKGILDFADGCQQDQQDRKRELQFFRQSLMGNGPPGQADPRAKIRAQEERHDRLPDI